MRRDENQASATHRSSLGIAFRRRTSREPLPRSRASEIATTSRSRSLDKHVLVRKVKTMRAPPWSHPNETSL